LLACFCGAPSLTSGRVCLLHMLLALTSAVFLRSLFLSLSIMLRWTVSRQVCLEIKHASGACDHLLIFDNTILFLWDGLSDERTGLSFVYAAGLRQRSLSWVRVPLDSWPYFTVSDLRLLFSSPPATREVAVEVFDPASTRVWILYLSLSFMLRPTVCRPVCLGIKHPSGAYDQIFFSLWQLRSCFCGASSLTRGPVCLLYMLLALASVVFSGFESLWTRDHILLSQIWDYLFVASCDSQGHGHPASIRLRSTVSYVRQSDSLEDNLFKIFCFAFLIQR
jgi:hypothetical protein